MKRLDFLKKILFGASALVVAPKLLIGKTSNHKLVADVENKTEESYHGLTGFADYESFDEEMSDFEPELPKNYIDPYVITLKNNTDNNIENIIIGNGSENIKLPNGGIHNDIMVTCAIQNDKLQTPYTYYQYLLSTITNPIKVGRIYIQSPMGKQSYVPVFINDKEFRVTLDPYRQQSSIQIYNCSYLADGTEKIRISELYSKSEISIYVFGIDDKTAKI